MNKHLYRVIFNQRRGQLMVVGEHAAAQGKQAAGTGGTAGAVGAAGAAITAITAVVQPLALAVFSLLGMVLFVNGPAFGQIVADPGAPGGQRPTIVQSGNGTTQVNIQTPSAAGVSRNTYSQFDVQAGGAILNNSRGAVQTQTGGWVQGNPWLANGSARVILNEVNSSNPSQLRGYVEVAGQRAEVVIANPAGMAVDGGGFINASRVVLTTGTPVINGGSLDGYTVQRGVVSVNGRGLDTALTDYTAILARAVQVNGGVWAKELQVVTGSNQIDAAHSVTGQVAGALPAPVVALDVAQLGGMYAGKITLIGTEAGLGVRNAGTLAASAGNLVLQSNGWLSNSGTIHAAADGRLAVQGDLANTGLVSAQGNLDLAAGGRIDSAAGAVIAAGLNTDNTLRTTGDLHLQAGALLAAHGAVAAGGDSTLQAAGVDLAHAGVQGASVRLTASTADLDLTAAKVDARSALALTAAHTVRNDGGQLTAQALTVNAQALSNIDGRITQLGATALAVDLSGALDNTRGVIASNSESLHLHAATLRNVDGAIAHAGAGRLELDADALALQRGSIGSNGALTLTGATIDHRSAHTLAGRLTVQAGALDNRDGSLLQTGLASTSVQADGVLDNRGGAIETNGAASIGAAELRNAQGRLTSGQSLALQAGSLDNQDGTLAAAASLQLFGGAVDNTRGRLQAVAGDAQLTLASLANQGGSIAAGRDLAIVAQDVLNSGSIYAGGSMAWLTGTLGNTGVVAAGGDNRIDATRVSSAAGSLLGAGILADGSLSDHGVLQVTAGDTIVAQGQNLAGGDLVLRAGALDLARSQSAGANVLLAARTGNVVTDGARVAAAGTLAITAAGADQALSNAGGVLSAGQLLLATGYLDNSNGVIVQTGAGDTVLHADQLDNTGGQIAVNSRNLALTAATVRNQGGRIEHAGSGTLALGATQLSGAQGRVTGNGTVDIAAGAADLRGAQTSGQQVHLRANTLDHRGGALQQTGAGQMALEVAGTLDNTDGAIASNGALALTAGALGNQRGAITVAAGADLAVQAGLDNRDGVLAAGQAMHTVSGVVDNTRGMLQAGAALALDAASLTNAQGTVSAGSDLAARVQGDLVNSGLLYAARDQQWTVGGHLANSGSVVAGNDNLIFAGSLGSSGLLGAGVKQDGSLGAAGALAVRTVGMLQAGGQQLAAGAATLDGSAVDLRGSQTSAAAIAVTARAGDVRTDQARVSTSGLLAITANAANGQALVNRGGQLTAAQLQLATGRLDNASGRLLATGRADVTTGQLDNTDGMLSAGSALALHAAGVDNTGGQLQAVAGNATLAVGALDNANGTIFAGADLVASAASVVNTGSLSAGGKLALQVEGALANNNAGVIAAQGAMQVGAATLDNRGGTVQAGQLTVSAAQLDNTQGRVTAAGALDLAVATTLDNTAGMLAAGGAARVAVGGVLSNSGAILAGSGNTISAGRLASSGVLGAGVRADGTLASSGDLQIDTAGGVQAGGQLLAGGNARLTGAMVDLSGAQVAAGDITLAALAGDVRTVNTALTAGAQLAVTAAGNVDNHDGVLTAAGGLTLTANDVDNTRGYLQATAGALDLTVAKLANVTGTIVAGGDLTAHAAQVVNTGAIVAEGHLRLTAGSVESSTSGVLGAGMKADGSMVAAGDLTVSTSGVLAAHGQTMAAGAAALTGAALDLEASQTVAASLVLTATGGDLSTGGAKVTTSGALAISTPGAWRNGGGMLYAGSNAGIDVGGTLTNTGTVAAAGDQRIAAADLVNHGVLGAGIGPDGKLGTGGALRVTTAGALQSDGQLRAAGGAALTGALVDLARGQVGADSIAITALSGDVRTSGAQLMARQLLAITASASNAQQLVNRGGQLEAGQLQLAVANLDNTRGAIVQTGTGDTTIATGLLDNTAGRIAVNSANLALQAGMLTNIDGKLEHAGSGLLSLTATATLDNTRGAIDGNGAAFMQAGQLLNLAGHIVAARDATFDVGALDNGTGRIAAGANLAATAASVDNGGSLYAGGSLDLDVRGVISHTGVMAAQGRTTVQAERLDAAAGSLLGAGLKADGTLGAAGDLAVTTRGTLAVHGQVAAAGAAMLSGAGIDLGASNVGAASVAVTATAGDLAAGGATVTGAATVGLTTSHGDIDTAGATINSGGDLALAAAGALRNAGGLLYAGRDARVTVGGMLTSSGSIVAVRNTSITAGVLGSTGVLGAGIKLDGSLGQGGDLLIDTVGLLQAGGTTLAAGSAQLTGAAVDLTGVRLNADRVEIGARSGDVTTGQARLAAQGLLAITANANNAQQLVNTGGQLEAGQLQLALANLDNTSGAIVQTGAGDTTIATGLLDNTAGRIAVNSANLALQADTLTNTDGKLEHAGSGALAVSARQLNDQRGRISSNHQVTLSATGIDHRQATTVGQGIAIAAERLDNTDGAIGAGADLSITGGDVDNTRGQLQASGAATLILGKLNNSAGSIVAGKDLRTTADSVFNSGSLYAAGGQALQVGGAVINTGVIAALGDLHLAADSLDSASGSLLGAGVRADGSLGTGGDLALTTVHTLTAHGQNLAASNAVLTGAAIDLGGSQTGAAHLAVTATAGALSTAGAVVTTAGALEIAAAGALDNRSGALQAGQLGVHTGSLDNTGGVIVQTGAGDTTLATGLLDNTGGRIAVNSVNLQLSATTLDNRNGKIEHAGSGTLALQAGTLTNGSGRITSAAALDASTTGALDNTNGLLFAGSDTRIAAAGLLTNTGSIAAGRHATISAAALTGNGLLGAGIGADGSVGAGAGRSGDLVVTTAGTLQAGGQILAAGAVALTGAGVDVAGSQVGAGQVTMIARSGDVDTSKAQVSAAGLLSITANALTAQRLVNTGGQLAAGQLQLQVANLVNTEGAITQAGGGDTRIDTGTLDNTAGKIAVNSANFGLHAATLTNAQGTIAHAGSGSLTLSASGALDNTGGTLAGNGDVVVQADVLRNVDGHLDAAGSASLGFNRLDNRGGKLVAGTGLALTGGDVDNTGGQLQATGGDAVLTIGNLDNTAGGIYAGRHLTTTAADVTSSGSLYALGNQVLAARGTVTNTGVLAALGNTTLTADALDSSAASLIGAGVRADGSLAGSGALAITTGGLLAAHGQNLAAGQAVLTGAGIDLGASQTSAAGVALTATAGDVLTTRATVVTPGALTITSQGDLRNSAGVLQGGQLAVTAANLDNTAGAIVQTGAADTIFTTGLLDNTSGKIALNSSNARFDASHLINRSGKIEHAGSGSLTIATAALDGAAGAITGNGIVDITAGAFDHNGATTSARQLRVAADSLSNRAGTLQSATDAVLAVTHGLDNQQGLIAAANGLQVGAGSLANLNGEFTAGTDLTTTVQADMHNSGLLYAGRRQLLTVGGALSNQGSIAALGDTSVTAQALTGAGLLAAGLQANGALAQAGNLTVTTAGTLQANGQNLAAGRIDLTGAALDLARSRTSAAAIGLTATSGNIDTGAAIVGASGMLAITANGSAAQALSNQGGQLGAGQLDLRLSNLSNAGGAIVQTGVGDAAIVLAAGGVLDNTSGRIAVNARNLQLTAGTLVNADGKIEHAGAGAMTIVAGNVYGQRGQLTGNGALDLRTAYFDHRNASTEARQLTLTTGTLDNRGGELLQLGTGTAVLSATGTLDNGGGRIEGNGDVALQAGELGNSGGSIAAGGTLSTVATNVSNGGTMYGAIQTMTVAGMLRNSGVIAALGDTTLAAGSIDSTAGSLLAAGMRADGRLAMGGDLRATAGQFLHAAGQNLATGGATFTAGSVDLSNSVTSASSVALTATAGNVITGGASVITPGALTVRAENNAGQAWDNRLGNVAAGQLQVQVGNLDNRKGSIAQSGSGDTALVMRAQNGVLDNTEGRIVVNSGNLTLGAATVNNTAGVITHAGAGQLALDAGVLNDQSGQITANGSLHITAGSIDHRNASTQAGRVTIDAASLDNSQGELVQLGAGQGAVRVAQDLDNRSGLLASNGNLTVSAANIRNQGGLVQVAGGAALDLSAGAVLDNSNGGTVAAGGSATVRGGTIVNRGGSLTAGGSLGIQADQSLDNTGGLIASNGQLDVRAALVENAGGRLASVNGQLGVIAGQLRNASGQLQAGGDVVLQTGSLGNGVASGYAAAGAIVGRNITIDTGGQTLDNQLGTIAAAQALSLRTGVLANQGGLMQGGSAVSIDTRGNALDNGNASAYGNSHGGASGGISSGGTLTLAVGSWNNVGGRLGAVGAIDGSSGYVNNLGGSIVSGSGLALAIGGLANQGGQIQAVGNLGLQAGGGAIDNSAGLIRSGATATLGAATIVNGGTQVAGLGIEGRDLNLSAGVIDNREGGLRADNNLAINSAGRLDNSAGLISANNALAIREDSAARALTIANAGGTIIGGVSTTLKAAGLSGVGSVMSKGDLGLDLSGNYALEAGSQVIANRNASLLVGGAFVNDGKLQAGSVLTVGAASFDNNASGDINAGATRINVAGTLNNRGVIDGISTQVTAGTLNNVGTGRLYGDTLAIGAVTLNNAVEGGVAATIASRGALDIGATTLNNSDHALIFSAGDMAIGGALDSTGHATGAATSVTNASATIQALGNLALRAGEVSLVNKNFKAEYSAGTRQYIGYYEIGGKKYDPSEVEMNPAPKVGLLSVTVGGQKFYDFDFYSFVRTTSGSVVTSSDPAIISAGGDLTIDAYRVVNHNSQITAGKTLNIHSQELVNDSAAAGVQITEVGKWDSYRSVYTDYLNGTIGSPETEEINRTEIVGGSSTVGGGSVPAYQTSVRSGMGAAGPTTGATATNVNVWLNTVGNNAGPVAGVSASQGQAAGRVGAVSGPGAINGSVASGTAVTGSGAAAAQGAGVASNAGALGATAASSVNVKAVSAAAAVSSTDRAGQIAQTDSSSAVAGVTAGVAAGVVVGMPAAGAQVPPNAGTGGISMNDPGRLVAGAGPAAGSAVSVGAGAGAANSGPVRAGVDTAGNPLPAGLATGSKVALNQRGNAPALGDAAQLAAGAAGSDRLTAGAKHGLGDVLGAVVSVLKNGGTKAEAGTAAQADAGAHPGAVAGGAPVSPGGVTIATVHGNAAQAGASALASPPRAPGIVQVALSSPSGKAEVVRTATRQLALPNASLFQVRPAVEASYLVETDPRYANYREWTGSDYMTSKVQLDPNVTQKRLGDGFYEQQLVREQVAELTGHRYTGDYTSDEEQYRGLMDAGVSYAQQWGLRPGVALSAEQMAALTSDIVWLVERDVTMADGSIQKALVPQLYVRLRADDIDGSGALLAGKDVNINVTGDLTNSGTIAGRDVVLLTADNVNNLAGRIDGDAVAIAARNDLNNISGAISANSALQASAGRDINVTTATLATGADTPWRPEATVGRVAGLYISGGADGAGAMTLSAGRDINIAGAVVSNTATGGTTALSSGRDISLTGATVSGATGNGATVVSAGRDLNLATGLAGVGTNTAGLPVRAEDTASLVQGGKVALVAGNDINNHASSVIAEQQLTASAGRDLNLVTSTVSSASITRKDGNMVTDTSTVVDKVAGMYVTGTGEGNVLLAQAGRDINLTAAVIGNAGVNGTTGLAAGHDLNLKTVDIASSHDVVRNADNYSKQSAASEVGSQINGAGDVSLRAGNDLVAKAAKVEAEGKLDLFAGNDISVLNGVETGLNDTASRVKKKGTFSSKTTVTRDTVETSSALGSSLSGAAVTIAAGHDLTVAASSVQAQDALNLLAKNDVSIGAVGLDSAESHTRDVRKSGSFGLSKTSIAQADATTATNVFASSVAGGAVTVQAGQDIGIAGSHLTAENMLSLDAGRDLLIGSVGQSGSEQHSYEKKKSGFSFNVTSGNLGYSKLQDQTARKDQTLTQIGSELSAGSLVAVSGRDAAISGSKIVADNDLVIAAGRDLTIASAQNTADGASSSSSTKSGSIGTRFQPAIGTVKTTQDSKFDSVSQVGSQVASLGGDVTLKAGQNYTQTSSDVLAPEGGIGIVAEQVLITSANNLNNSSDHTSYNKTAIGGSISVPIIDAAKSLASTLSTAGKTSDPRMQALAAVALASKASDLASIASKGIDPTGIKVSISLGNSKSESEVTQTSSLAVGSTVKAGGDVSIVASGAGPGSDLTITGSNVSAGGNLALAADDQVNVLAAQNTQSQASKNSSSGTSVGVGINFGGSQSGFSFEFSANQGRGKADGTDTFYTNSYLTAGKTATIVSGGDTTLKGGVTTADTIRAAIGGNLNIASLQDSSIYASESRSAGVNASVCIPPACYGVSTVGGSVSKNKANGNFVSVVEQTGLKAGDGGFQLNVAGNTDSQAGLITSSQKAIELGTNSLATATLTTSELENKDEYAASGYSVSGSVGTKASGQGSADTKQKVAAAENKAGSSGSMGFGSTSGSQSSSTAAGISAGSITIGNAAQQETLTGKTASETIAGLNRDVSSEKSSSGALKKAWDARKMEQEVQTQVAITEAFSAAASSEIGKYADGKLSEAETLRENANKERDPAVRDDLLRQAAQIDRDWSEGGTARLIANTAAGALGGGLIGMAGSATGSSVSGALYHANVPASMDSLPLDQQARIQKMANEAGFNSMTSDADWQTLKLVADLRFDPESQNLPQAEVNGRIGKYLGLLGATSEQISTVLKTFEDAGLAAVNTPRIPHVEQKLLGPTSAPDEVITDASAVGASRDRVFLGTKMIDKGTQGIGQVLTQVGGVIDSSPVAKFTVEALDFASGPVIYGVNKIPVVEDLKNQAMGAVNGYFREGFNEAGYDQTAADNGAVGGGAIISVGLGGFASTIKNIGKKFDFAASTAIESAATGPNRIYSARELLRRVEEPGPFHNFPEALNAEIFGGTKKRITDTYVLYTKEGTLVLPGEPIYGPTQIRFGDALNNPGGQRIREIVGYTPSRIVEGTYELGVRPSASGRTEVITHRFFRPKDSNDN